MEERKNNLLLDDKDLREALEFNRFGDFFWKTKKYKQFYLFCFGKKRVGNIEKRTIVLNKGTIISFIFAIILTYLAINIINKDLAYILDFAKMIIPVLLGGMFTILGLSLAGLAIVTGTLKERFITILIKEKKLYTLISILFNFYFSGFLIGITIILLVVSLFSVFVPIEFNFIYFVMMFFLTTFFVFFSTIFSITLLGTCIRLFLTRYAIELKKGS